MSKLKIAIVGCGRVSRTAHYSSINNNSDYQFTAVCDIDQERANRWAAENNVKPYYDLETLLRSEQLDLVSINTPNGTHARLATQVARAGINVIVEKPLAMNLADADALIDECEFRGVKLFVVMQNRYNKTNQILKSCIDSGRFGRIHTCHVNVSWHRELNYYTEDHKWRSRRDLAGGVFTNQCVHYLDMMQWLIGAPPETAYAKMGTAQFPIDVEDHGAAIVRFKNGVIGSFSLTNLAYPTDIEGSITVAGETGYVKIGGKSMNKIEIWNFATSGPEDAMIREAESNPPTVYGFGHIELYRTIASYIKDGVAQSEIIDGREGRKAVALMEGFYTSDQLGTEIRYPLGKR
jgi:UDP-N-acetyl-2-amino-2-deoxyglucuronate dehydrogenase